MAIPVIMILPSKLPNVFNPFLPAVIIIKSMNITNKITRYLSLLILVILIAFVPSEETSMNILTPFFLIRSFY